TAHPATAPQAPGAVAPLASMLPPESSMVPLAVSAAVVAPVAKAKVLPPPQPAAKAATAVYSSPNSTANRKASPMTESSAPRWRLVNAHYLNVETLPDGTRVEWEHKETARETGRTVRKLYPVPMYLDPKEPADCN